MYLFQLAYQLLNRITDLDLISDPYIKQQDKDEAQDMPKPQRDQDYVFGCQAELDVTESAFPPASSEPNPSVDIRMIMIKLSANDDVQKFF